jgi:hypothetical protein
MTISVRWDLLVTPIFKYVLWTEVIFPTRRSYDHEMFFQLVHQKYCIVDHNISDGNYWIKSGYDHCYFKLKKARKKIGIKVKNSKGPNRVRTGDLLICSQLLYHWAMDPFCLISFCSPFHSFSVLRSLCLGHWLWSCLWGSRVLIIFTRSFLWCFTFVLVTGAIRNFQLTQN